MSSNISIQRICQFCNAEFMAKTTVTKYCSHNCNRKAYKLRLKEKKIVLSDNETIIRKTQSMEELNAKIYLTIGEACILLSVSRWTIWRIIKNGQLNATSVGRRKLICRSDIDKLLKNHYGN